MLTPKSLAPDVWTALSLHSLMLYAFARSAHGATHVRPSPRLPVLRPRPLIPLPAATLLQATLLRAPKPLRTRRLRRQDLDLSTLVLVEPLPAALRLHLQVQRPRRALPTVLHRLLCSAQWPRCCPPDLERLATLQSRGQPLCCTARRHRLPS